jgi:hypothetical protein
VFHGDAAVFDGMDHITINCASAVIADDAYAELANKGLTINSSNQQIIKIVGEVLMLQDDAHINANTRYDGKFLIGNDIWVNTDDPTLGGATGITANKITCCESAVFAIPVYASEIARYPDGAIIVAGKLTLGTQFLENVPAGGKVWTPNNVDALDDGAVGLMVERDITLFCNNIMLHESANTLADRLIIANSRKIVPDGCALIDGDLTLDEFTVDLYGDSIYITGALTVPHDGAEWLRDFKIFQCDKVTLPGAALPLWKQIGKANVVVPYKGHLRTVYGNDVITHAQLTGLGDVRYTLYVNGVVTFAADVTAEDFEAFHAINYNGVCYVQDCVKAALLTKVKEANGQILTYDPNAHYEEKEEEIAADYNDDNHLVLNTARFVV